MWCFPGCGREPEVRKFRGTLCSPAQMPSTAASSAADTDAGSVTSPLFLCNTKFDNKLKAIWLELRLETDKGRYRLLFCLWRGWRVFIQRGDVGLNLKCTNTQNNLLRVSPRTLHAEPRMRVNIYLFITSPGESESLCAPHRSTSQQADRDQRLQM